MKSERTFHPKLWIFVASLLIATELGRVSTLPAVKGAEGVFTGSEILAAVLALASAGILLEALMARLRIPGVRGSYLWLVGFLSSLSSLSFAYFLITGGVVTDAMAIFIYRGTEQFDEAVKGTGVSASVVLALAAYIGVAAGVSARLARPRGARPLRWGWPAGALVASLSLVLGLHALAGRYEDPTVTVAKANLRILYPLFLGTPHPHRGPLLGVELKPVRQTAAAEPLPGFRAPASPGPRPPAGRPGLTILFVLESVRADQLTPEAMPALFGLSRDSIPIPLGIAAANYSYASWHGIFAGDFPRAYVTHPHIGEAVPMRVFKDAGYRIALFTPEFNLYNGERFQHYFGKDRALLAELHSAPGVYEPNYDQVTTDQVLEKLRALGPQWRSQRNFLIVMLESSHYTYDWPARFPARYTPVLSQETVRSIFVPRGDHVPIMNRYRNSIAFVDSQVGRVLDELKRLGMYDETTIAATGDHGEEFWEKGHFGHANSLSEEQTHVPVLLKLPGVDRASVHIPVMSQIHILPTLVDQAGIRDARMDNLGGRSILRPGPEHEIALTGVWYFTLVTEHAKFPLDFYGNELGVTEVTTLDDRPLVPGDGSEQAYTAYLAQEVLPRLPYLGLFRRSFRNAR